MAQCSEHLRKCGPRDEHGAHLGLGKEEGILHDHASHEVCHMCELVGSAAVPHSIDVAVCGLKLISHLHVKRQSRALVDTWWWVMSGPPPTTI